MNTRRRKSKFKLIQINAFDVRWSYKRCTPGGNVSYIGKVKCSFDFWKDRYGRLVVRISNQGYYYHFEALLTSGKQIPEDKMGEFEEWVAEGIADWVVESIVDEVPDFIYET